MLVIGVSIVLVVGAIFVHCEALRLIAALLPRLHRIAVRWRMVFVVFGCVVAHAIEVWLFAFGYWLLDEEFQFGSLSGHDAGGLLDMAYFSVACFTTLGFGDIFPLGEARLLAGVEAIAGLLLIAWSATFTYLAMQRLWPAGRAFEGSEPDHGP